MTTMPQDYYQRFDQAKGDEQMLFVPGALPSADMNDLQLMILDRIQGIGGALFKDGAVTRGCDIVIDPDSGRVMLGSGEIYIQGAVRRVGSAVITIPTTIRLEVGVRLVTRVDTHIEDPTLLDPAEGSPTQGEPGAPRLRYTLVWCNGNDPGEGTFYGVYTVDNGVLLNPSRPPTLDPVVQALADYDRDANGHYVVAGHRVRALDTVTIDGVGKRPYVISAGTANVSGFKVRRPVDTRLVVAVDPDLSRVDDEPHLYTGGSMRITTNRAPIAAIIQVEVTKEKTVTLTRGAVGGTQDPLPDVAVLQLVSVTQGATTYTIGTAVKLTAGMVDWSPGAQPEPLGGSTYTVTYRYITSIAPTAPDDLGFTVSGAVPSTLVQVTYDWKLPRYDRIVLDQGGDVQLLKGLAHATAPAPPAVPSNLLGLATIKNHWRSGAAPTVVDDTVRVVPMANIEGMGRRINDAFDLIGQLNLRLAALAQAPTTVSGLFIDNFADDTMADLGVAQTAVARGGELMLPMTVDVALLPDKYDGAPWLLAYEVVPVIEQTFITDAFKINPYMSFAPLPARVVISPAIDQWMETRVETINVEDPTTTTVTIRGDDFQFRTMTVQGRVEWGGWVWGNANTTAQVDWARQTVGGTRDEVSETSTRTTRDLPFLREIPVTFAVEGFGAGENLAKVEFDGIDVTPAGLHADGAGKLTGQFIIPPNVPAGSKAVRVTGQGGTTGSATFVGKGQITIEERRLVAQRVTRIENFDPLAQTFMLDNETMVAGVEIQFQAIGDRNKPVIVELRDTQVGMPTRTVLAQAIHPMANAQTNVWTRIDFGGPVRIDGGQEYAIVLLTDDPDHAVHVAKLGGFDQRQQKWVTQQPYQVGVMLSSSNARTWTAHQEYDLAFRLLRCRFPTPQEDIVLGSLDMADVSGLLALAGVERMGTTTDVEFLLTGPGGQTVSLTDGAAIELAQRLTGTFTLKARLKGDQARTPLLYPGVQMALANLAQTGQRTMRRITAASGKALTVVVEALLQGTATMTMEIEGPANTWTTLAATATPIGDNWAEMKYAVPAITHADPRLRITLNGTAQYPVRGRRLRGWIA